MWVCEALTHPDFGVLENPFYWVGSEPPIWPFGWIHNRISGMDWLRDNQREVKPMHGVWLRGDSLISQMWSDAQLAGVTCVRCDRPEVAQNKVLIQGDSYSADHMFQVAEPGFVDPSLWSLTQETSVQNSGILTVQETQDHLKAQYGYTPSSSIVLLIDKKQFLNFSGFDVPYWLEFKQENVFFEPFQTIPLPGRLIWNAQLLLMGRYMTQLWGRFGPSSLNHDESLVMGYQKNLRSQRDQKLRKISASFAF